jgi:glycosyltransferase involved in cell wall biosynthesis
MSEPVRLTVLVSTLVVGGAEQALQELLSHLDPARVRPHLLFLKQPGQVGEELLTQGVPAEVGLSPRRFDPWAPLRVAAALRRGRTEVLLLINHLNTLVYGAPAARLLGVPVVNWQNETHRRYRLHRMTMLCRRLLHHWVDALVAAADGHAEYLSRVERLPTRVITIHNSVDPNRLTSVLSPSEARARLGLPNSAKVVAQVAALRPDKAHEDMLTAMAQVIRAHPDAYLLVVGDGPRRVELEALAASLGLSENCRFLGTRRDIGDILAAADVGALSSRPEQETLSLAAIETMFAGKPMVMTDVGFMRELVIPGRTGLLTPHSRPEELAAAIERLLCDDAQRARMGAEALRHVSSLCSIPDMARRFERLLIAVARRAPLPFQDVDHAS